VFLEYSTRIMDFQSVEIFVMEKVVSLLDKASINTVFLLILW
jgi:hypothetical protein